MSATRIMGALLASSLLAGCVTGYNIENLRDASGSGSEFAQGLTAEYKAITLFEADEMYDWPDADYFARKGLRAAGGEIVEPEAVENWDLPADKVGELRDARARLVALLDATARTKVPSLAAHAQGRFDCWIEQQEENHQPAHIAACREEFYAALAALEEAMRPAPAPQPAQPAPTVPETFVLFFEFDRAVVTPAGMAVIDDAIAAARRLGVDEFAVTGHADRSGPEDYNLRLSIRRAEAVRDVLVSRGIAPRNISLAGRGESEPAVPTPDGVREQANRRVEIFIQ